MAPQLISSSVSELVMIDRGAYSEFSKSEVLENSKIKKSKNNS
jgi:hypothetical protein